MQIQKHQKKCYVSANLSQKDVHINHSSLDILFFIFWFLYYKEDQECPFGSSCFYKHINQDGTIAKKKKPNYGFDETGKSVILKEVTLADFLFDDEE